MSLVLCILLTVTGHYSSLKGQVITLKIVALL